MPTSTEPPGQDDLEDIQGNVVGFNKPHQQLLFLNFPSAGTGKAFLAAMADEVNSAEEVKSYNKRFSLLRKNGVDPRSEPASWVNLALTFAGLSTVQAPDVGNFPSEFQQGMAERASIIGDVDDSAPASWPSPFALGAPPVHAMVIAAADLPDLLADRVALVQALVQAAGVTRVGDPQLGEVRPGDQQGHEHFGFKDGISQPGIRGLTQSSKGGEPIAAGEFLIGYEDEDGVISGSAAAPPAPGEPGYPGTGSPTPALPRLPDWARNGSFVVYRKLQQNVGAFRAFLQQQSAAVNLSPDQLGAKMVGRWPSGAPLEHVPTEGKDIDATVTDPAIADEHVLDDDHINKFGYQEHDADGHLTPHAAHIRKSYPRDAQPPGMEESNRHRILRRGIPYGEEFASTEPPYGTTVPPDQDRGLLFLCYQASISDGFEFIQSHWINDNDFPIAGDGRDPIVSQDSASPNFAIPGHGSLATSRWVTTRGGEYFFSPSRSSLRLLGS